MYKKMICVVATAIVLSLASHAWADLILHWRFDEGSGTVAHDSSGNGRDGVFDGNPTWVAGRIGGALEFSGGGERVVDDDAEDYLNGLDAVTMSIWIKSNETNSDRGFIIGEEPDGGDNLMTMRYDASGATGGGTNLLKMAVVAPNDEQQLESSNNLQTMEWQHVALVWSRNEQLKFYVNAELDTPVANGAARDVSTGDITMLIVGQGGKDSGRSWNGLIDDVRIYDEALTAERIQGVMIGEGYPYAMGPNPADGALHEDTWVNLSWSAGDYAVSHDVYLGENFDDVSNATPDTADIFRGNQTALFYVAGFPGFAYPDGLVPGTTYYWRIDEVNEADPNSPWKGPVWSFSIPPKTAYNPDPPNNAEGVGPDNVSLSWTAGYGAKLHTVFIGNDYDEVSNAVVGITQGTTTYNAGTLEVEKVYYWRVDEFDAIETHKGDIWTFTTPGAVGGPKPADNAVGVAMTTALTWTAATSATSHQVYLGLDKEAVRNADTSSPEYQGDAALGSESIDPGKLVWLTTYYWRVDAVTNAGTVKGPIWSFTTADFISIDDFESYTDDDVAGEAIWQSWIDGFGVADNGAQAGNLLPPYAEQSIVHGGLQSMPLFYTNEGGVTNSEAALTLTQARDWTEENVGELSLWVRGSSVNAAEPLYVAVSNAAGAPAIVANDDPVVAQKGSWIQWVIPLQTIADQGITLTNVDKIGIGLGSKAGAAAGGTGTMYIDDIALYRSEP